MSQGHLGCLLSSLGQYGEAKEYLEKALRIHKEIGDREMEGQCYGNLGVVFFDLGQYSEAKKYYEKALLIGRETGCKKGEVANYANLGSVFRSRGEYDKAKEYHCKAIAMSKEIGHVEFELKCHQNLAKDMLSEESTQQAFSNLYACINKCEDIRARQKENDEIKISFLDEHIFPYRKLSELLCISENPTEAIYVVELGRARALADLMSAQYSVEKQLPLNPRPRDGFQRIIANERNCCCLYISYADPYIFLWIFLSDKSMSFRINNVKEIAMNDGSIRNLDNFLGNEITFRKFHTLPQGHSEDRSLFQVNCSKLTVQKPQEESPAFRLIEEDTEEDQEPEPSLSLYYKLLITPVADLLDEPEIIIVPDRSLYSVPFAALKGESGQYLSESFRIRIVPSLTTLMLIQESPADYHSQTGALIVGDPEVGDVIYKGHVEYVSRLNCARKEAEIIGRVLGVQPLLGQHATKQVVLESLHSVSLIHFAAHGNAERGEIALAPRRPTNGYPHEEEYLLTTSDVAKVRLRAKLVVLSCCHSGRGQIRSEGVVGIARAFLGSGARSVLVALWALEDSATEQLMSRFYEHLVRGESASESLNQAMKWMRVNGYSNVRDWAPFILIGDDVTFDFAK